MNFDLEALLNADMVLTPVLSSLSPASGVRPKVSQARRKSSSTSLRLNKPKYSTTKPGAPSVSAGEALANSSPGVVMVS